jgi:hypothetical protein
MSLHLTNAKPSRTSFTKASIEVRIAIRMTKEDIHYLPESNSINLQALVATMLVLTADNLAAAIFSSNSGNVNIGLRYV